MYMYIIYNILGSKKMTHINNNNYLINLIIIIV